ncbi:MAG TPA: penicillin-binding transpeptidase domain-containing protein [Anaerolineales bacterium]|nr:penicillin-binding transpeptidase domain-containing protein [Anaerolineales bacterium]
MKFQKLTLCLILLLGLVACAPPPTPTATLTPTPTSTLAPPAFAVTHAPDPVGTGTAFLEAWKLDDYAGMYGMLSSASQASISQEAFTERYLNVMIEAAIPVGEVSYEMLSTTLAPENAVLAYRIHLHSVTYGELTRDTQMSLGMENGTWRIFWDETMILPELAGGNTLTRITVPPERGVIYDRNGEVLVGPGEGYSVGIVPAKIDPDLEDGMLSVLERATGTPWQYLYAKYFNYGYEADFYVPLVDVEASILNPFYNGLVGYEAVQVYSFSGRYYFGTGIETGYVSAIQQEEVDAFTRAGYLWAERVPRAGVELWADQFLAGKRATTLSLNNPAGDQLSVLGTTPGGPADSVYLTLDKNLQTQAQTAINRFRGAIVVLERDTGRVLAMVSSPGFDPNLFNPDNYNALWESPLTDASNPLFNRATRGQYPLGSVFKIITMAAALESGLYTPDTTYDCQYEFTELPGTTLYDWTWDHFQEDGKTQPSGTLTLQEGLMRSCNPWFYHIGYGLFSEGLRNLIPDMARGFGLGSPTGIIGVPEEVAGQVPTDPDEPLEATNLAIGQGELQVTPLQVAAFVAAVGNGGTLYRPQMVEQIVSSTGTVLDQFAPEVSGTLPIKPETLAAIQEAMGMVIRDSRGTAYGVVGAYPIEMYGKTGTAQVGGGLDPHAWFVTYTNEGDPDRPDIAVVVLAENAGEGSEIAAPIARRILDIYFFGRPRLLYPWEDRLGVPDDILPQTPTPEAPADNNNG